MYLFYRLLLAHIIADFPLQTNKIYRLKSHTRWGVLVHASIVLLFSIFFSIPYLKNTRAVMAVLFIFLSHTIIDKLKLAYLKNHFKHCIVMFIIDQFLHILIIFLFTFNFSQKYLLSISTKTAYIKSLIEIYNNDILIVLLIGYLSSVFIIPIFLNFIKENQLTRSCKPLEKNERVCIKLISNKVIDKVYRLFLTLLSQYINVTYTIILLAVYIFAKIIPNGFHFKTKNKRHDIKRILNTTLALVIGIILKFQ